MIDLKRCSKCMVEKGVSAFPRDKHRRDGICPQCTECRRAYYQDNRLKCLEISQNYRESHREYYREYNKDYQKANLDKFRAGNKRRYGRRRAAVSEFIDYEIIVLRDRGICYLCNESVDISMKWNIKDKSSPSFDHVVPLSRGGTHTMDNLRLTHWGCNNRKRAKLVS